MRPLKLLVLQLLLQLLLLLLLLLLLEELVPEGGRGSEGAVAWRDR